MSQALNCGKLKKGLMPMKRLLIVSPLKRFLFFVIADAVLISAALYGSLLTHSNYDLTLQYWEHFQEILIFFIAVKVLALAIFRVYGITWRYVGLSDLINIFLAVLLAELVLTVLSLPNNFLPVLTITGLPKRVFFIDGLLSLGMIEGLRISKRLWSEVIRKRGPAKKGQNTIIVGAGNTGEMLLRDLMRNNYNGFYPVGFLDDDPKTTGSYIHGVKVLGDVSQLSNVISKYSVQAIIIAIPRLNHKTLRNLYDIANKASIKTIKIVPRIYDFSRPDVNMKSLESISIEDLVGRQTVCVDYKGIGEFIRGKSILVTGAGGSIGSEIVIQVCSFQPEQIILFDIDETELHNLGIKLRRMFPLLMEHIAYVTGDVRDEIRLQEVFDFWRPQVVFHAAAYKHVPMMEHSPKEAVKVNVFGTYRVASTAREYGVEKFVMISTDKAVRPTSVMGATKRMAEFICSALNEKAQGKVAIFPEKKVSRNPPVIASTRFVSVRFGNVLGSRGSVLPLFLEQLKHGGPLTVTHREMKRYFMTIPEAVSLVLQASILGSGGEVFVLDMGKPAKIIDIAEELIRIHGMEPYKDIDIQITEQRPGEKLFEEILTAEEGTDASLHEKIFVARNLVKFPLELLKEILEEFKSVVADPSPGSNEKMRILLKKYVKHYVGPDEVIAKPKLVENPAIKAESTLIS
jgi:FlaA1/EpsC-like NDP-sugar epimerase